MKTQSVKGHIYTKAQREVMKGMAFNPSLWCNATRVKGSNKRTYTALYNVGAILVDSNNRFHLTAHGRAMVERFP